jgi:hypothetical protein
VGIRADEQQRHHVHRVDVPDNRLVTIDASYNITSLGAVTVAC